MNWRCRGAPGQIKEVGLGGLPGFIKRLELVEDLRILWIVPKDSSLHRTTSVCGSGTRQRRKE